MPRPFSLDGNALRAADARKADRRQEMFVRKFGYDPHEQYVLNWLDWLLNNCAAGWPWRCLKAKARDHRKSELK